VTPPPRYHFLDGLRGWGAFFVVLYHVFANGFPPTPGAAEFLPKLIMFNGPLAVCIFFVVSGFALSVGYLSRGNVESLVKSGLGRYFRLALPIFASCSVVHIAAVTGLLQAPESRLPPWGTIVAFEPTVWHLVSFALFDVFFNFDLKQTYIGPLWTMQIELMGSYAVLALVIVVGKLKSRNLILWLCGALLFLPISYLSLFAFGAAFADSFIKGGVERFEKALPLVAHLILATGVLALLVIPATQTVECLCALLITFGAISVKSVRDFLSNKLSVHLGLLSFPLYLLHGAVMLIVGAPLMQHYGHSLTTKIAVDCVMVVLSFTAAYAFLPVNDLAMNASRRIADFLFSLLFGKLNKHLSKN